MVPGAGGGAPAAGTGSDASGAGALSVVPHTPAAAPAVAGRADAPPPSLAEPAALPPLLVALREAAHMHATGVLDAGEFVCTKARLLSS